MRATIASLLVLAAGVLAQNTTSSNVSTSAVPQCALTCVFSTLPSSPCASYGVSNVTCICTSQQFQLAYYQCQQSSCSSNDLQAAENYGATICEQNGTPINISATPSGATAVSASQTGTSSRTGGSSTGAAAGSTGATTSAAAAASTSSTPSSSTRLDSNLLLLSGVAGGIVAGLALLI